MSIQIEDYEKGALTIGAHTYGTPIIRFKHEGSIEIGKFCSIGADVIIYAGGNHRTDWVTTYPLSQLGLSTVSRDASKSAGKVVIGNGVWIGSDVIIMSGTTIGHGAAIGAASVVRGNIPPYSLAYGNPCRVQRMLFPPEVIAKLLETKWWDWSVDEIKANAHLLESNEIEWIMQKGAQHEV